ncbi:lysine N(6)-hydroxylase/L-ornithine N(5)-oxygenase family protein [Pseudomonas defluvii]|uniref:lysine N(6)-hydroxylase/L-ornithine N(5)-oxygenase family protein n=1 Tax=Pseudomonas defluvii TaxID=1876757 RepID=UPI0039057DDC
MELLQMAKRLDVAGIGVGPFNLSLAALMVPQAQLNSCFFERRPRFDWHAGMMLPGTYMQTSYLKDMVTPVDPASRYGFLNYLVDKGRFYRFINAEYTNVRRVEYADYMRWVSEQLPNVAFSSDVQEVTFDGHDFVIGFANRPSLKARHIVVATGLLSHIPEWGRVLGGEHCQHSHGYMHAQHSLAGKRVTVVGGGQSGAEIFLDVLSGRRGVVSELNWITRRANLEPLDETPFTNEYFSPDYVRAFYALPEADKRRLVVQQKLAGDGVSPVTLRELSQALYENEFLNTQAVPARILPQREVVAMQRHGGHFQLTNHNGFNGARERLDADEVILATGYQQTLPKCIAALIPRLVHDQEGGLVLNQDYSAQWDGPASNRIYVQNAGRYTHGIADPQLSLAAWRSAVIINSIAEKPLYATTPVPPPLTWSHAREEGGRQARA